MKPRVPLIALMAAVFTKAALMGCACLATKSPNPRPAMTLATTTVAMAVPATTLLSQTKKIDDPAVQKGRRP